MPIRIRIRIRNFKIGSADPDPDPKKIGPDPQHWFLGYIVEYMQLRFSVLNQTNVVLNETNVLIETNTAL